jgi:hypothetical protein
VPGWGVAFFRLGEVLQEWMYREGVEEFALFGGVFRSASGTALAVTLQTEGKWREREERKRRKREQTEKGKGKEVEDE